MMDHLKAPAAKPLSPSARLAQFLTRELEMAIPYEAKTPEEVAITIIRALQAKLATLRGLLEGWQDLLEDGAVNCGEDQATEHWDKVNAALASIGGNEE